MKKTAKKITAAFLMFFILISFIPFTATAATGGKSQERAVEWARSKNINHQKVGNGECVALIKAYYEFLGVKGIDGNASTYSSNALPKGWQRIPYSKGFVAKPGDIAVWTWNKWARNNGHVAIVAAADSSGMTFYDQGKSYGYVVHKSHLSYNNRNWEFYGVIRPDFTSSETSDNNSSDTPEKPVSKEKKTNIDKNIFITVNNKLSLNYKLKSVNFSNEDIIVKNKQEKALKRIEKPHETDTFDSYLNAFDFFSSDNDNINVTDIKSDEAVALAPFNPKQ